MYPNNDCLKLKSNDLITYCEHSLAFLSALIRVSNNNTLRKLYFHFLSYWTGYDRDDSFPFDFEPNGIPFGSENRNENCHHDHIPFNVKENGNIVFSVYEKKKKSSEIFCRDDFSRYKHSRRSLFEARLLKTCIHYAETQILLGWYHNTYCEEYKILDEPFKLLLQS